MSKVSKNVKDNKKCQIVKMELEEKDEAEKEKEEERISKEEK